ncbi:hypothetical protein ACF1FD_24735, partial [Streptomyces achromogenes]
ALPRRTGPAPRGTPRLTGPPPNARGPPAEGPAVAGLVSLGLTPLSMPVAAAATGAFGLGPVYAVSAGVCGLGGLLFLAVPALRRAELPG